MLDIFFYNNDMVVNSVFFSKLAFMDYNFILDFQKKFFFEFYNDDYNFLHKYKIRFFTWSTIYPRNNIVTIMTVNKGSHRFLYLLSYYFWNWKNLATLINFDIIMYEFFKNINFEKIFNPFFIIYYNFMDYNFFYYYNYSIQKHIDYYFFFKFPIVSTFYNFKFYNIFNFFNYTYSFQFGDNLRAFNNNFIFEFIYSDFYTSISNINLYLKNTNQVVYIYDILWSEYLNFFYWKSSKLLYKNSLNLYNISVPFNYNLNLLGWLYSIFFFMEQEEEINKFYSYFFDYLIITNYLNWSLKNFFNSLFFVKNSFIFIYIFFYLYFFFKYFKFEFLKYLKYKNKILLFFFF